jgi:hypothetical protein
MPRRLDKLILTDIPQIGDFDDSMPGIEDSSLDSGMPDFDVSEKDLDIFTNEIIFSAE